MTGTRSGCVLSGTAAGDEISGGRSLTALFYEPGFVSNGNKIFRLFLPTYKESRKVAKRSQAIDTAPKAERLVEQSRMG